MRKLEKTLEKKLVSADTKYVARGLKMYELKTLKDGQTVITLTVSIKSVQFKAKTRREAILKGLEALKILRGL